MDKPPPPPHVVEKRKALNEAAYCAVLRTVTVRRATGPNVVSLLKRLRAELGITNEQHANWQSQFVAVSASDVVPQQPVAHHHQQPYMQQQPQHPFLLQQPQQQQQQPQQAHAQRQHSVASTSGRAQPLAAARSYSRQPSQGMAPVGAATGGGRNKRKASVAAEEPDVIGFRVQRWRAPEEEVWRTGCITAYRPDDNYIRITYDIGTGSDWHEWVPWQQDPTLVVLVERINIADYGY